MSLLELTHCIRLLDSDKATERKKQIDVLQCQLVKPVVIQTLDKNTDLKQGSERHQRSNLVTWDTVFKGVKNFILTEAGRLRSKDSGTGKQSSTVLANRKKEKQMYSQLFKFVVRQANQRGPRLRASELLNHISVVLNDSFTLSAFGFDYTTVLLREVLSIHQYLNDVSSVVILDFIKLYCRLTLNPPNGWDRSLLTQVLHRLIIVATTKSNLKSRTLLTFFSEAFKNIRNEKSSGHHEGLLEALIAFCKHIALDCRTQLCKLGELIFMPFLYLWSAKPSVKTKEKLLEFWKLQLGLHHPQGVSDEGNGAFACNWEVWKSNLKKLYNVLIGELQQACGRNKYSSSKELFLKPSLIEVLVEVCHHVFKEDDCIEVTQLSIMDPNQVTATATKKRRLEVGMQIFNDSLHALSSSVEAIPWLQLLAALLSKYPEIVQPDDLFSLLDLLLQIYHSCKHNEIKPWVLCCLQSFVIVQSYWKNSSTQSNFYWDQLQSSWAKTWELTVRTVALNQCHQEGHKLMQLMLESCLVKPGRDFYTLYLPGSSNSVSSSSLCTLSIFMTNYSLPTQLPGHLGSSFFHWEPSSSSGCEKEWFRYGVVEWLLPNSEYSVSGTLAVSSSTHVINTKDKDLLPQQANLIGQLCLRNGSTKIDNPGNGINSELVEWQWIRDVETNLLKSSFDIPLHTTIEPGPKSWNMQQNREGRMKVKLVESVWKKVVEALMRDSSRVLDILSHSQSVSQLSAVMENASLIIQIYSRLWNMKVLSNSSPWTSNLGNLVKSMMKKIDEVFRKAPPAIDQLEKKGTILSKQQYQKSLIPILDFLLDSLKGGDDLEDGLEKDFRSWALSILPQNVLKYLVELAVRSPSKTHKKQLLTVVPPVAVNEQGGCDLLDDDFDLQEPEVLTLRERQPSSSSTSNHCAFLSTSDSGDFSPKDDLMDCNSQESPNIGGDYLISALNHETFSEAEIEQFNAVYIMLKWCKICNTCTLSSFKEDALLPTQVVQKLMDRISSNNLDVSAVYDVKLALLISKELGNLKGTLKLKTHQLSGILDSLRHILREQHKDSEVCVACLDLLSALFSHLVAEPDSEIETEMRTNRDHALHLLNAFWKMHKEGKCTKNVMYGLAKTTVSAVKLDPTGKWFGQKQNDGSICPAQDLAAFLCSPHHAVRMFAAENIGNLFQSISTGVPLSAVKQQDAFEIVYTTAVSSLQVQGNLQHEELSDEGANRTSSLLMSISQITLTSLYCEKQAIFALCQIILEKNISVILVKKVLTQISRLLGYPTTTSLLEAHVGFLVHEWLQQHYSLSQFPFSLLDCQSEKDFYKAYYWILLPLLFNNQDLTAVQTVGEKVSQNWTELLKKCLSQILAYIFPWFGISERDPTAKEKQQQAVRGHRLLEDTLTKKVMESILELDQVIIHLLSTLQEDQSDFDEYDIIVQCIPPANPPCFSANVLRETWKYLMTCFRSDQPESLVHILCQKKDSIQQVLLSLRVKLSQAHRTHEKQRVMLMYLLCSELLLPELKTGLGGSWLFVIRDFVFTALRQLNIQGFKDDAILILCIELLARTLHTAVEPYPQEVSILLPEIVSCLIPHSLSSFKVGEKVRKVLNFLVVDCATVLGDAVSRLPPFPDAAVLETIRAQQQNLMYRNGPFDLKEEIQHFLNSTNHGQSSCEALRHIHKEIREKKEELKRLLEELQEKWLFSEDVLNSPVHQLVCHLIHQCRSEDKQIQKEASACLGEIGPVDLSTIVLQPKSQIFPVLASAQRNFDEDCPKEKCYCAVFHLLNNCIQDNSIEVVKAATNVLKTVMCTHSGQSFMKAYIKRNCDNLFTILNPFQSKQKAQILNLLPPTEADFVGKIDDQSLWSPEVSNHEDWVTRLMCALLESKATQDEILQKLIPVCRFKADVCKELLPYVVHIILLQGNECFQEVLSRQISGFFEKHCSKSLQAGSRCTTPFVQTGFGTPTPIYMCKASVQTMLSVIHHLRLQKCSWKFGDFGWKNNFWLDIDYLCVAQAATFCSAHFTALLYTEIWCDQEKRKRQLENRQHHSSNLSDNFGSCSQDTSTLASISSCDQERAPLVHKLLMDAYCSIGEPDGVYGCGEVAKDSQDVRIQCYEQENRWDRVLSYYDLELTQNTSSRVGLLTALQKCGLNHVLYGYLKGVGQPLDISSELLEYQCESAWRISQWDVDLPESNSRGTIGFQQGIYQCLTSLVCKEKDSFIQNLEICRCSALEDLNHTSLESVRSIYPALCNFQMLGIMSDYFNMQCGITDVAEVLFRWNKISNLPSSGFDFDEPVLWLEYVLLRQHIPTAFQQGPVIQGIVRCLENYAEKARKENCLSDADKAVHTLRSLSGSATQRALWWKLEEAKVYWDRSEVTVAKNLSRSLLRNLEGKYHESEELSILYAETLTLYGSWLSDSCCESSETIMTDFLEKAVQVLDPLYLLDKTVLWNAYLAVARYADAQYQNIVNNMRSLSYQAKQGLIRQCRREAKKLEEMKKIVALTKEQTKTLKTLIKQSDLDERELNSTLEHKNRFLRKALGNYLHCLLGTDAHDLRVFRLTSLWFQNSTNEEINTLLKNGIAKMQSYKFLPLIYQLAARMGKINQQSVADFCSVLFQLIEKITLDHPFHALPVIFALSNAEKDTTDGHAFKLSGCQGSQTESDERVQAAKALLSRLKKSSISEIATQMEVLCEAYINLAYLPIPQQKLKPRSINKIPTDQLIVKIRNLHKIPPLTQDIQVDRSCKYNNLPGIRGFEGEFRLCGGITVPKVIFCNSTDGFQHIQLVKGGDDLRQDAVMQQVFRLVNCLLWKNSETRGRKLSVRTYKVVPLSRRSGVLQWCERTQPFGEYLIGKDGQGGAHLTYYPQSWTASKCRNEMSKASQNTAEEKLKTYLKICQNFLPVFRYFFLEQFPEPAVWFERRLAYTQSVATCSIVGHILGLGDRHVQNILIDKSTAEMIHIDLGVAFEQGKLLPTPETVPFRLTRDVIDGMGVSGVEGVFRRCCEKTMEVMRKSQESLLTILEVLLYDPLYVWTLTPTRAIKIQHHHEGLGLDETELIPTPTGCGFEELGDCGNQGVEVNKLAERVLLRLQQKLQGVEQDVALSVNGQANYLIQQARDPHNLSRLFPGWQPYI
ncbi:serine-protein kinase ATM-like [Limulus polyphemus]|uniref:non-specific serine/threonine protein kinase n=1 Tax=Limulus polyphemus TaxID=6850 RepID=A0ABM1T5N6_LIMPO|nr:serine-protein kinase ATM-like [Limulus polyphemus]